MILGGRTTFVLRGVAVLGAGIAAASCGGERSRETAVTQNSSESTSAAEPDTRSHIVDEFEYDSGSGTLTCYVTDESVDNPLATSEGAANVAICAFSSGGQVISFECRAVAANLGSLGYPIDKLWSPESDWNEGACASAHEKILDETQ